MPVVPFASAPTSRTGSGRIPKGPPPAEPFALMAAAQMHAEGRLLAGEPSGKNGLVDER